MPAAPGATKSPNSANSYAQSTAAEVTLIVDGP